MDKIYFTFFIFAFASVAVAFAFGIPVLIERQKRKKWKKMYDSVQVGDKYVKSLNQPDPFEKQWGGIITIVDKKMNKDGVPYVKYSDGYFKMSKDLPSLIETFHYVPYTNQDKEQ